MKTSEIPIWPTPVISGWVICTVEVSPGVFRLRRVPQDQVGATGPTGATGATGATGLAGPPSGLPYTYSATLTEADPGLGFARLDNATPGLATNLYISETDSNGSDVASLLFLWDFSLSTSRGVLIMYKVADPSVFASWAITGAGTDNGAWKKFPLTMLSRNGEIGRASCRERV